MASCCGNDYDATFSPRAARRYLRRYRRRGPDATTQRIVSSLVHDAPGATLIDVGGGVGAIQHGLFDAGLASAVSVDASAPFAQVAAEEARRRGVADRITAVGGDFVAAAPELDAADLVTLDRVICCYPDMPHLAAAAASHARRALVASYPSGNRLSRIGFGAVNVALRLGRRHFRTFVHDPSGIDAAMREQGLELRESSTTSLGFWRVSVWVRATAQAPA